MTFDSKGKAMNKKSTHHSLSSCNSSHNHSNHSAKKDKVSKTSPKMRPNGDAHNDDKELKPGLGVFDNWHLDIDHYLE